MPDVEAGPGRIRKPVFFLGAAILLSIGGLAAFIYLFVLDFNLYWLILSPVILALYQLPAAFFFWLHKRAKRRAEGPRPDGGAPGEAPPAG
jgi:hypothetical protein